MPKLALEGLSLLLRNPNLHAFAAWSRTLAQRQRDSEAAEPDLNPRSFTAKYSPSFAETHHSLCEEIVHRSQWRMTQANGEKLTVPSLGTAPSS